MKRKRVPGTVATYKLGLGGLAETLPLQVLKYYVNWGDTPKYWWGDARAAELAVALKWALANLPETVKQKQEEVESDDQTGSKV